MLVVGGPPGSGKSSLFPIAESGLDFFNVDDRCAALNGGSYQGISKEVRARAGKECEVFVEEHVRAGGSFAVETTLRTKITLEQAARAKQNGFVVHLRYVAVEDVETSVERVTARALRGGHAATPPRLRETYASSISNLVIAVRQLDSVVAYDNSRAGTRPRLVLRARHGKVLFAAPDAPGWVRSLLARLSADLADP